jgi:hypothetical protein
MAHRDNCQTINNRMEGRLAVNDFYDKIVMIPCHIQCVCFLFCFSEWTLRVTAAYLDGDRFTLWIPLA